MDSFIILWPYLLTNKLKCLQKNNIGHTIVSMYNVHTQDCRQYVLRLLCILVYGFLKLQSREFIFCKKKPTGMVHKNLTLLSHLDPVLYQIQICLNLWVSTIFFFFPILQKMNYEYPRVQLGLGIAFPLNTLVFAKKRCQMA